MQAVLWSMAATALLLAGFAAWADRRRSAREGVARIGWVPWTGVTVALLFVGVGAMVLALHG